MLEGEWLRDVHVRADAAMLGGASIEAHLADKLAAWVNQEKPGTSLSVLSPAFPPSDKDRYALAHASFSPEATCRAIVVSDTCHVWSCLGMRPSSSPRDRTLLVPLVEGTEELHSRLLETGNLGRMPLPAHELLGHHPIAEMRFVYAAEGKAHRERIGDAVLKLQHPRLLADYWSAFATRKGAMVAERNIMKLAAVVEGGEFPTESALGRFEALAETVDLARVLEGTHLERASDLGEQLAEEAAAAGEEMGGEWTGRRGAELAATLQPDIAATLHALREAADEALKAF